MTLSTSSSAKQIQSQDDLRRDLAGTFRATRSTGYEDIPSDVINEDYERLMRDGYVILPNLLSEAQLLRVRQASADHLGATGRNTFEGELTQRVYDVFSKTRSVDPLAEHPRVLALLDRLLQPNYLLSQTQIINILPKSPAQLIHHDDAAYPVPRPRPPLGAATVWAIDPFTRENGATVVVPGSHKWPEGRTPNPEELVPCEMPAGSAVLFLGTLWHGGGANTSAGPRLAVTSQYCEPWVRQQENFILEVSRETVRQLSENLIRMIGYSVYPPFFGMVNGMHPKRLLEIEQRN
ncbi:phytanoyl-CoA dioxygenase family protein [Pseudomonas gingeri]|uniref:phytanoyl-CoA dioxygenase family protein n=1 Tax=Pseudomonas gingeri TaxID=117681 RepID=UPI0035294AD5